MERAQANIVHSALTQRDVVAHHLYYVGGIEYLLFGSFVNHMG